MAKDSNDPALRTLMADPKADQAERAKAFEAKHPGITARVGENGELSFSNVPGRDVYGPYMKEMAQTDPGKEALKDLLKPASVASPEERAAATEALGPDGTVATVQPDGTITTVVVDPNQSFLKPASSNELFAQQYKQLASLTNIDDLINAKANITSATQNWVVSKHNELKSKAERAHNVAALRAEVQRNEQADRQAYLEYNDGVDLGDSDETLLVKQQLAQAEERARLEAGRALEEDPELAGAKTRMEAIDALVNSRLSAQLQADVAEAKIAGKSLDELVLPEQVVAVKRALGQPADAPLDPQVEKQLKIELASGTRGPLTQAMEAGLANDKSAILSNSLAEGSDGLYGRKVLISHMDGDANLAKALQDEARAQMQQAATPPLGKDGKPKPGYIPPTKAEMASLQQGALIKAREAVKIKRDANFEANVHQWELPQDPDLQTEVQAVIKVMQSEAEANKAADPNYDPASDPAQGYTGLVARLKLVKDDGNVDKTKVEKVANWYASQANQVPGNSYFGPPSNALDPKGYVEQVAVSKMAVDQGLFGEAKAFWGTVYENHPTTKAVRAMVSGAVSLAQASAEAVVGTGKPLQSGAGAQEGAKVNYNPAVVDPNYKAVTEYYRGRAGVDPEWLAERDRNIAAAEGGQ